MISLVYVLQLRWVWNNQVGLWSCLIWKKYSSRAHQRSPVWNSSVKIRVREPLSEKIIVGAKNVDSTQERCRG